MSLKVITIFLFVLVVKITNAQSNPATPGVLQGLLGVVVDVVNLVPALLQAVIDGLTGQPAVNDCGVLRNGTLYYIQSADGKFAVVDPIKELAFMQQVSESGATQFTAVEKDCNLFGFCANGFCMSRCEGCTSDSGDFETVSFEEGNSDGGYSQWTLASSVAGGPYTLQVDNKNYLTYKTTASGDQLTLSTSDTISFSFVAVS